MVRSWWSWPAAGYRTNELEIKYQTHYRIVRAKVLYTHNNQPHTQNDGTTESDTIRTTAKDQHSVLLTNKTARRKTKTRRHNWMKQIIHTTINHTKKEEGGIRRPRRDGRDNTHTHTSCRKRIRDGGRDGTNTHTTHTNSNTGTGPP